VDLLPGGMPGPPESKWCQNRLRPYLCLGPEPDATPGDQEAEEYIEVGQPVFYMTSANSSFSMNGGPTYRPHVKRRQYLTHKCSCEVPALAGISHAALSFALLVRHRCIG
jgi:hypothetical protein